MEEATKPMTDHRTQNEDSMLAAKGVHKSFGRRSVLDNVEIDVAPGEIVGLLGPNGAGKTTLFMIMCGLLKPDQGQVFLKGVDVSRQPLYWRAQHGLGYLPQESSVFRNLTVEQNILAVLQRRIPQRQARQERLDSLLEEFNLTKVRKSKGSALSGGERRRAEVARCLANDPSFVLLDEPFAGVDPIAVGDVRSLIIGLAAKGIGILITDHNVQGTLSAVHRAAILSESRVLAKGTPSEILANDAVRRVYLGEDFTLS